MFKCLICGKRHYKGSVPAQWCHSTLNPDYMAHILMRHTQGFHGKGTGGHPDCPSCRDAKPEQMQLFRTDVTEEVIQVLDICGCQG